MDENNITDSSTEEGQTVPLERFNEVYGEMKTVQKELTDLKTQIASQSNGATPEQQKELEAKEILSKMINEELTKSEQARQKSEQEEIQNFQTELKNVLELNSDVKKEDFVKFLEEEADEYGVETVSGAMKVFKKLNETSSSAVEKAKETLAKKPNLPGSEGAGSGKTVDDSGKSFSQIAEEAKGQLK